VSIETITLAPFALAYFVILPQLLWSGIQRLVQWYSDWRDKPQNPIHHLKVRASDLDTNGQSGF
jgi:predicted PurR-regulated permease PerM